MDACSLTKRSFCSLWLSFLFKNIVIYRVFWLDLRILIAPTNFIFMPVLSNYIHDSYFLYPFNISLSPFDRWESLLCPPYEFTKYSEYPDLKFQYIVQKIILSNYSYFHSISWMFFYVSSNRIQSPQKKSQNLGPSYSMDLKL